MNVKKNKIILLVSKGGSGHIIPAQCIKDLLADCEVIEVASIEQFLGPHDILHAATFGRYSSEKFYNGCIRHGWLRFINGMAKYVVPYFFKFFNTSIQNSFYQFLLQEKPDLVISLVPVINYPASKAAERAHVPFLLITLDGDLSNWLMGFKGTLSSNIHIAVPALTPTIVQQLQAHTIPVHMVYEIGFPLRKEFFAPKNEKKILADWAFPPHRPIILVMTGGVGANRQITLTRHLLALNLPIHLAVCIGKNVAIQKKLEQFEHHQSQTTLSIIPFTQNIADLMAVSDVLITKPGANTCFEAIQSQLPVIFDVTKPGLFWELHNIDWVTMFGTQTTLHSYKELGPKLTMFLSKKNELKQHSVSMLKFKQLFRHVFNQLVKK